MSSKQNDTNNTIHLGNYEEFFILYMDNELTPEQMKMVDEFLISHPDLRGELEVLMSIKLPAEEFSIIKDELYADNMQLSYVGEDLLSYIDNELDADKIKIVEFELAANKDYRLQHELLLQTKLDAAEEVLHPNKKELYREEHKVIAFRPWMRVAVAVVVIAVSGIVYFTTNNSSSDPVIKTPVALSTPKTEDVEKIPTVKSSASQKDADPAIAATNKDVQYSNQKVSGLKDQDKKNAVKKDVQTITPVTQPDDHNNTELVAAHRRTVDALPPAIHPSDNSLDKHALNNSIVTSDLSHRIIEATATDEVDALPKNGQIASRKEGSVKGFLRKATRLIEKRTGIDPTNSDGELLIGAVAVKLK